MAPFVQPGLQARHQGQNTMGRTSRTLREEHQGKDTMSRASGSGHQWQDGHRLSYAVPKPTLAQALHEACPRTVPSGWDPPAPRSVGSPGKYHTGYQLAGTHGANRPHMVQLYCTENITRVNTGYTTQIRDIRYARTATRDTGRVLMVIQRGATCCTTHAWAAEDTYHIDGPLGTRAILVLLEDKFECDTQPEGVLRMMGTVQRSASHAPWACTNAP